ncbi:hypothetical protein [Polaromonas sp. SM01]|uniref:hypothetical protein n=1 Tax=Polaromonas sp. SM01 TaxID=3085630 RepID=UPI0029810D58|nr:hypothetical protein [Polaromonas sp. SM01]MDW5443736.1 hypothetical protein [Polaromonas sp. SM01]
MNFVWALVQVLVGAFILFTVARVTYSKLAPRFGWGWVLLVFVVALANMLLHRFLGNSINPPFFTAVLFGITLNGIAPASSDDGASSLSARRLFRQGIAAVVVATLLGWLSYAEVGTAPSNKRLQNDRQSASHFASLPLIGGV